MRPIEGFGRLLFDFRSDEGPEPLLIRKAAHIIRLITTSCHLEHWQTKGIGLVVKLKRGITIRFKSGNTLFAPSLSPRISRLSILSGKRRSNFENGDVALTTISPGVSSATTEADINAFQVAFRYIHAKRLCETARRHGVKLVGRLEPCEGCSRCSASQSKG